MTLLKKLSSFIQLAQLFIPENSHGVKSCWYHCPCSCAGALIPRIREYLKLGGTHKGHRVQLPAPRRTT